jgi:starvation-inducible outer membrane lipoprotein
MQSNKGKLKWQFNSIAKPTIVSLMTSKNLKTFVGSIKITAETFILLMKRIFIITPVTFGEHLLTVIGSLKTVTTKGTSTNENMAG